MIFYIDLEDHELNRSRKNTFVGSRYLTPGLKMSLCSEFCVTMRAIVTEILNALATTANTGIVIYLMKVT